MLQSIKRYGIMGGTFDPIHMGHLFIAQSALKELQLDKVIFIPTGVPPHKTEQKISPVLDRYMMTSMAINNNEHFCISPIEMNRKTPSYTIDTVKELLEDDTNVELYFITGTDTFMSLETWKDFQELFKAIIFVVAIRPGFDNNEIDHKINAYTMEYEANILKVLMPALEISSTDIRKRVALGKSIKYIVSADVEQYIIKNELYK